LETISQDLGGNMALNHFECTICCTITRSFDQSIEHCGKPTKKLLVAPSAKLMEPRDALAKDRGKSQLKGHNAIVKARARNFKRDHELNDLIQLNDKDHVSKYGWLNEKGVKRSKIDDI